MNITSHKKVLYVDDEALALKYFAMMFSNRYSIVTATSAEEARRWIDENADDLAVVVTDQRMPKETGVELMEWLRHRHPNVVRVLLTAFADLDAAIKSVNDGGAFRYVTKPVNEPEMLGVLARAMDYHQAMDDRDRLLKEKLSVLHRLIIMDRLRGLATMATALQGRVRNAWGALVAYMRQSPPQSRIRVQLDEILGLNMVAVARRESEFMVKTVQMILDDAQSPATGMESDVDVSRLVDAFVERQRDAQAADDVALRAANQLRDVRVNSDVGLLNRLLEILTRRIADMQDQPLEILVGVTEADQDSVTLRVRGNFEGMTNGHVISLFSAAIPLQKWPIGLDMDLLSAFMIVHHLGGELSIEPNPPAGPGFVIRLAREPAVTEQPPASAAWFDQIYESIAEWESEILESFEV